MIKSRVASRNSKLSIQNSKLIIPAINLGDALNRAEVDLKPKFIQLKTADFVSKILNFELFWLIFLGGI